MEFSVAGPEAFMNSVKKRFFSGSIKEEFASQIWILR
jgi:hypothetical protein